MIILSRLAGFGARRPRLLRDAYVTVVALAGLAVILIAAPGGAQAIRHAPMALWVLTGFIVAGDLVQLPIPHRTKLHFITCSNPFAFAVLLGWGAKAAILVYAAASIIGDLGHRKPLKKLPFNAAQYARLLGGDGPSLEVRNLMAFAVAATAYLVVNTVLVRVVVGLHEQAPLAAYLRVSTSFEVTVAGVEFATRWTGSSAWPRRCWSSRPAGPSASAATCWTPSASTPTTPRPTPTSSWSTRKRPPTRPARTSGWSSSTPPSWPGRPARSPPSPTPTGASSSRRQGPCWSAVPSTPSTRSWPTSSAMLSSTAAGGSGWRRPPAAPRRCSPSKTRGPAFQRTSVSGSSSGSPGWRSPTAPAGSGSAWRSPAASPTVSAASWWPSTPSATPTAPASSCACHCAVALAAHPGRVIVSRSCGRHRDSRGASFAGRVAGRAEAFSHQLSNRTLFQAFAETMLFRRYRTFARRTSRISRCVPGSGMSVAGAGRRGRRVVAARPRAERARSRSPAA